MLSENQRFFDGITIDDYTFCISITDAGKAELLVEKAGKQLKSVPAAFKKNEAVLEMKEFVKKLKDQYSHTVKVENKFYLINDSMELCLALTGEGSLDDKTMTLRQQKLCRRLSC